MLKLTRKTEYALIALRHLRVVDVDKVVSTKDIAANYRLLLSELELTQPVIDPARCISRIASNVKASEKIKRDALHIIKLAKNVGETEGKDPMGIASASLYLAILKDAEGGKVSITQRQISLAAEVTDVTIRNRLANLRKLKNVKEYIGDPIGHSFRLVGQNV